MQIAMMISGNKKNCAIRSEVGFLTSTRSSRGGTGTLVVLVSISEHWRIWDQRLWNQGQAATGIRTNPWIWIERMNLPEAPKRKDAKIESLTWPAIHFFSCRSPLVSYLPCSRWRMMRSTGSYTKIRTPSDTLSWRFETSAAFSNLQRLFRIICWAFKLPATFSKDQQLSWIFSRCFESSAEDLKLQQLFQMFSDFFE